MVQKEEVLFRFIFLPIFADNNSKAYENDSDYKFRYDS